MTAGASLKSKNLRWLCAVAAFDIAVLGLLVTPSLPDLASISGIALARAASAFFLPVIVLLVTSIADSNLKAVLIFWRFKNVLPGHRAFSLYAANDARIDLNALRANVGPFPTDLREQNSRWFKLYRMVDSEPSVIEAHKNYLLFRDLAFISAVLTISVPISFYALGVTAGFSWATAVFLAIQYAFTALAARNSGVRFVTNVLAIHSAKNLAQPASAG